MNTPPQTQPIGDRQTLHRISPFLIVSVLISTGLFLLFALAVVGLFYSEINYSVGIALMLPAIGFALIFILILRRYGPQEPSPPSWPMHEESMASEGDPIPDWPLATETQPEI